MSWAEVSKINSNFKKSLNEQARELAYAGAYILTSSGDFKPDKSGWYKVIVVGAGGESDNFGEDRVASGGSGGVAIKTMYLSHLNLYAYEVTANQSIFNGEIIATTGGNGDAIDKVGGDAGLASGGDLNYSGSKGEYNTDGFAQGQSVGVYIPELMRKETDFYYDTDMVFFMNETGYGVLGYGASGGYRSGCDIGSQGGAVIIIPLEFEE